MTTEYQYHPAAAIYDLLDGDDFRDLAEDIEKHGLLTPIWLHPDGSILDGRNRYRACLKAGVAPVFQTWNGEGFPASRRDDRPRGHAWNLKEEKQGALFCSEYLSESDARRI
jgi:hypothetical protein